jgi:hypothetical protein
MRGRGGGDLLAVCRYDDTLGDADLRDALPHSDDEREPGELTKGFSGETRGAQSRWDDGERPHAWRSAGVAHTAATITF